MDKDFRRDLEQGRAVSVAPLADALNVSAVGLYGAIRRGELKVTRVGKRIVIPNPVARQLLGLEAA